MRYLAIDLGDKRTGLAIGDDGLRMAMPVAVLEVPIIGGNSAQILDKVVEASRTHLPDPPEGELVLGLPLNMDGTEGPRARLARAFGEALGARTGRRVHMFDERLTTAAADWALAGTGFTHKQKKERRDALAAAAMLQGFLDALAGPGVDDR